MFWGWEWYLSTFDFIILIWINIEKQKLQTKQNKLNLTILIDYYVLTQAHRFWKVLVTLPLKNQFEISSRVTRSYRISWKCFDFLGSETWGRSTLLTQNFDIE